MTSNSVMEILMSIPDAKGTVVYLKIMKSITDTFLDKSLECLVRVEKAWYCVVFFTVLASVGIALPRVQSF